MQNQKDNAIEPAIAEAPRTISISQGGQFRISGKDWQPYELTDAIAQVAQYSIAEKQIEKERHLMSLIVGYATTATVATLIVAGIYFLLSAAVQSGQRPQYQSTSLGQAKVAFINNA